MPYPELSETDLQSVADAYKLHGGTTAAATALGLKRQTFLSRLKRAAAKGLCGSDPVLPGFRIKSIATKDSSGAWIKQGRDTGDEFKMPDGHTARGVSALVDEDGRVIQKWIKTGADREAAAVAMETAAKALAENLPRVEPTPAPAGGEPDLLNQFVVTDLHMGMLAWGEEAGADYDLKIAERLIMDWFAAAIEMAPKAETAVFAQLGDLMHHDSLDSVTPASRHVLDADSRLQKIIRVVIRCVRQIIAMLAEKHARVHVVMASANHDPASSAWLREMLHALYESEPRVTIDRSPSEYYAYQHGKTALFYHHGHRRKVADVDSVFAGQFREMYGATEYAYAHVGHLHSDAVIEGNLMRSERHRTLAPRDAYAASGGWLSKRDAKVITYHKEFGEVGRLTLSPSMVAGRAAANDNQEPKERVA